MVSLGNQGPRKSWESKEAPELLYIRFAMKDQTLRFGMALKRRSWTSYDFTMILLWFQYERKVIKCHRKSEGNLV